MAIFIDTNVPIYAAGGLHTLKEPCRRILRLVPASPDVFCTDAEVLQELLHRFIALKRWPEGRLLLDEFSTLMDQRVEAMLPMDVLAAATLADENPQLSARDLIHVAVMRRLGIRQIVTADRGFDRLLGIERLDPALVNDWSSAVLN